VIKLIKKFQIKLTPFDTAKTWNMSTINNQNLLLHDSGSYTDPEIAVALEFIDYDITSSFNNYECDIALEQQDDDLVNTRIGLEKSVYVRESAAAALGMLGDIRAIDPLVSILETKKGFIDKFTFLKEKIIETLSKFNSTPLYIISTPRVRSRPINFTALRRPVVSRAGAIPRRYCYQSTHLPTFSHAIVSALGDLTARRKHANHNLRVYPSFTQSYFSASICRIIACSALSYPSSIVISCRAQNLLAALSILL
jgi:hypothetical protein